MTRNEVWEIERVPSTEKKNLWWTKYELQQNKKRKKSQQQKAEHKAFLEEAKLDAQRQAEIEAKEAQRRAEREAKIEAEREAEIEEDPFYDDDDSDYILTEEEYIEMEADLILEMIQERNDYDLDSDLNLDGILSWAESLDNEEETEAIHDDWMEEAQQRAEREDERDAVIEAEQRETERQEKN